MAGISLQQEEVLHMAKIILSTHDIIPEKIFSIFISKFLDKAMIRSEFLSFFKNAPNPKPW